MVSLEYKKSSEWSIGKIIAPIAIGLLITGPFFPYLIVQIKGVGLDISDERTYFDFDNSGLWMLLPLLSAILIIILLYLKIDIYYEKNGKRIKINSIILMLWGFLFFLMYLSDAVLIRSSIDYGGISISYLPGFGLGMIIVGYILCSIVGYLEWVYSTPGGLRLPIIGLGKKKQSALASEVKLEQEAEVNASIEPEPSIKVEAQKEVPVAIIEEKYSFKSGESKPEPIPLKPIKAEKNEKVIREPTTEEEKMLLKWASHINEYGQTFEKCTKCKNYVFMRVKDKGDIIVFNCPDCGASFILKK
jgi:predicted RNA-binding Zn-ribbon protein involved in translation (DUF1610 family)